LIENWKSDKYGNKRKFNINLHLKDGLGMEFASCKVADAIEEALM